MENSDKKSEYGASAYFSFSFVLLVGWLADVFIVGSYLVYVVRSECVLLCIYGDTHPFRHWYYDNIHSMQSILVSEKWAGGIRGGCWATWGDKGSAYNVDASLYYTNTGLSRISAHTRTAHTHSYHVVNECAPPIAPANSIYCIFKPIR